jgi:CheY-like chemotaxis protein
VIKQGGRVTAKLLIADDSNTIQKVFERTFPTEEFTLSFANNGEEALTKARTDKPNVIIADINMPAKNGFELCTELKKDPALRGIPVLLLIGILDDYDEDEGRRVGADGFIIKPFESNAAISKVREALSKGENVQPTEGPAGGKAEEIVDLSNIAQQPPAASRQEKGAEDILSVADIIEEPPSTPSPPQEQAEEVMDLTDMAVEPSTQPTQPPKKKGAEDILSVADIIEEPPSTPSPPQEQAEEVMDLTDMAVEPTRAPPSSEKAAEDIFELPDIAEEAPTTPPPQEQRFEDTFELPDIELEPTATPPTAPSPEKKAGEEFVLQTSLRELEEELKAEFPEGKTGVEEEVPAEFPKEKTERKEDFFVLEEDDFGSLELDLPFDDSESEPQAKDADWTTLFGELGLNESGEDTKQERLGTILDESTSELEKIEGLGMPKKASPDEEAFTKKFRDPFFGEGALESEKSENRAPITEQKPSKEAEEFVEEFMDDFEPVFEPSEDFQDIVTSAKDMKTTGREGPEDLAEKVASRVGSELQGAVEKMIKEKIPDLVRQEIDRLKKE